MLINRTSLSQTVDAINAADFSGRALPAAERSQAARWIVGRQGLPGAYGGTFAGFPSERSRGIVLFTGERIASASARHILGEEASRALRQLRVRDPGVTRALEGADNGLMRCLERAAEDPRKTIRVCSVAASAASACGGTCSRVAWIDAKSGFDVAPRTCDRCATANTQWRRFPFWYTVLALSEMDNAEARTELKYAAPALERAASRAVPSAVYGRRRHELAVRALNRL